MIGAFAVQATEPLSKSVACKRTKAVFPYIGKQTSIANYLFIYSLFASSDSCLNEGGGEKPPGVGHEK